MQKSDGELLREYAEGNGEKAFGEIVARHTNLVYSAALRQVGSPEAAAEVAQEVFMGLARGARTLAPTVGREASLAGWLCRSARNLSLNYRRDEFRRRTRERLAMENLETKPETTPDWERLKNVLDEAMAELEEADYDAIVLRFFRSQDFRAVGAALGVSDDAAQKRVSRALEKLRGHLGRRGVQTTAAGLALILPAKAIEAAPAGLAASISSAAAAAHGAAQVVTMTKSVLMTTLQKLAVAAVLAAAVGTGIYEARRASALQAQGAALALERDALTQQVQEMKEETARKPAAATKANGAPAGTGQEEVARLRRRWTA